MLFVLSDELMVDSSHSMKIVIVRAIKHIATSVFESKHLLSGSLEVLKYFKEEFKGDFDLYSLFNTLENNYYSTSFDFVKRRTEIVISISNLRRIEGDVEIFQSSINDFQDTLCCQASILLGEDFNDCNFFTYILKWYISKNALNINYNFDTDNGGGVNICRSIDNHIENKRILLSIIDTDRKYPNSPTGDTYNKCRKYLRKEKGSFKLIALDVQEIENLMPFNLLDNKSFSGEHASKKEKFDYLRSRNPNLLQYFDIKKGIRKKDTENDSSYKEFAKQCCDCNPDINDFDIYYNNLCDSDYVYPPLSRIFNLIEEDLKNSSENFVLLNFQEREWNKIGEKLLEFGCARNKEALN